jgi:ubiquinone/menaquinone biosynthesis C-methylase UbiE
VATRERDWATEYFETDGTVATWWDPLAESDPASRQWFAEQQRDLMVLGRVRDRRVLDAATGRGRAAIACAQSGAASIDAVDVSSEMLVNAESNARAAGVGDIQFTQAFLEELPFPPASFDVVLLLEVLLHLAKPDVVLRELRRVLAPGGTLVITTVGANPLGRLLQPAKRGVAPASRTRLAGAAAINAIMTATFGFTWARTGLTARLYRRLYNAPVRPLYPNQVRRMLASAGFTSIYHRAAGGWRLVPREHRWLAISDAVADVTPQRRTRSVMPPDDPRGNYT